MQVGGALNPFSGDAAARSGLDRDTTPRKENLPAQPDAETQGVNPSSATGSQAKDEFIRSSGIKKPQDEEKARLDSPGKLKEKDREKAEEDAAKEAADARKRKNRAEISVLYSEDIPDPSDPHNPSKTRTVYRRGPTYPAPEFGLGIHFSGIF